jgi:hypothetical protein
LHFHDGEVEEQTAGAWEALRSLRELHLDDVTGTNRLLPVLSSLPSLRLLRWRCRAPPFLSQPDSPIHLPQLESLRLLLCTAPRLQVELVMQRTFDAWLHAWSTVAVADELTNYQRRVWDELHQMPADLPRVRIVEIDSDASEL